MESDTLNSHEFKTSRLMKTDSLSLSVRLEGSNLDQANKRNQCSGDEVGTSSSQMEIFLWVNDYKCSLCGVELPPSFVEERQEHSDFHLAERLQEEESGNRHRNLPIKQRYPLISCHVASLGILVFCENLFLIFGLLREAAKCIFFANSLINCDIASSR